MSDTLSLPPLALLILCGPSGSGKSTWARKHFLSTQIVASDECRAMILDDAASQVANEDAFALFHTIIAQRLKHRRFTVADSTALKPKARADLLALARTWKVPAIVVAFDVPLDEAIRRDARRDGRTVGERVVTRHCQQFQQALVELKKEKSLGALHVLTPEAMDASRVERVKPATEGTHFDVIGDIHGCFEELQELFEKLGYVVREDGLPRHPDGRLPVFVGDLTDRGPHSPEVLRLAIELVAAQAALFVPGNHDAKLFRMLRGATVQKTHGLDLTDAQLRALPDTTRERLTTDALAFLEPQPCYVVLDGGRLVVAHAGIKEEYIGRYDEAVVRFTRFGDVTGFEENGMPIRRDWAQEYAGSALIAYGHTPQEEIKFVNNTVNLDGGCVFGGFLAALRYPEREIVTVMAKQTYAERHVPTENSV
jgi:protein phosphatase